MYRLVLVVGTAALLNVACGGANLEEERNTLLRLDREWSEAASDPDKFMGFFAADASFYPPGMPVAMGAGPIRDTFTKMMSMPGSAVTFGSSKAEVSESGDVGYTTGTYEMTMAGMSPEKESTSRSGRNRRTESGRWWRTSSTPIAGRLRAPM